MNGPETGLEILPGVTLLRLLGRGGMGEAWLARDAARGADVVAKLLPADAPPERLALLRREARLVRKLRHPGIVRVYGFHEGERFCAVTQRFMPGGDALALRGAPARDVIRLGAQVADALAYLHELGVVHRDVKASNVLLDAAGRAHLADFGIASVAHGDGDGIVLHGGGSRASMSPQQRQGAPPTPADDLFSLGVLLFELLTGRAPADGEAAASAPALWTLPVPERLRALVASLLASQPEARPRTAEAVRDELVAVGATLSRGPAAAGPASSGPSLARAERTAVRLQPPPRVVEPARRAPEDELFASRPTGEAKAARVQLAVVGSLVLAALAAVFWLPGWAERRAARQAAAAAAQPSPTAVASNETRLPEAIPTASVSPEAAPPAAPAEARSQSREPEPSETRAAPPRRAPQAPPAPEPAEPAASEPQPAPTPDREAEALALQAHRDQGLALEAREEWRAAAAQYAAALAIDPHVTFAVEGRERAEKRAAIDEALAAHAARPDRLSAPAVSREAEALLERARGAQPAGPALQARIAALEKALAAARQPVAVVIESDGITELTLSRVGKLGPVTRRRLELLPGTYTVTGSRRGYRDVRRQFSVAPDAPPPVVALRCEEAL